MKMQVVATINKEQEEEQQQQATLPKGIKCKKIKTSFACSFCCTFSNL